MNTRVNQTGNPKSKPRSILKLLTTLLTSTFVMIALFTCMQVAFAEFHTVDGIKWNYEILEDGTSVKIVYGSEPADPNAGNISGPVNVPRNFYLDDGKVYTVTELEGAFNSTVAYGGITSVTLPDTIKTIGRLTFNKLSNLTSVVINGNSLETIGASAFYGCKNLSSITLPSSVTTIDNYAFYNCENLTSITIPNNVTTFGTYVFRNCTNLQTAIIGKNVPSLTGTFTNCGKLESVTIPNSVTSINYSAFYGCGNLTSITVPCNFDKNKFSPSSASYINIPETDLNDNPDDDVHTFTVQGTSASGTFTYTHEYGNPTYTWEYDDTNHEWKCTAKITCSGCGDEIIENGIVTGEMTKAATCSAMGETTYTAVFTTPIFSTQTKSVEDVAIDPDAHSWKTDWDCDESKHWHQCSLCGVTTDEADHSWEMDSMITEATDTTPGEARYLCSICGQEKTEAVSPHHNSDGTEDVHGLTNLYAPGEVLKHFIDLGAEKLKELVDKYSKETPEQSETYNPDTGDHLCTLVFLIIGFSSSASLFEIL